MRVPVILLALLLVSTPALRVEALTDKEIVQALELVGDFRAAYPLALALAERDGGYQAWRDVAAKYARFDRGDRALRRAWEEVRQIDSAAAYRDFLTLRPSSPFNALAVHGLFQITRQIDTIQAYRQFMDQYPNAVEAAAAMLRIHDIAWERAREENSVAVYDAFVRTFPVAKQVPDALRRAGDLERQAIDRQLADSANLTLDRLERTARRLFNDARLAERDGLRPIAARRYQLLEDPRLRETRTYTDYLDRTERLEFQRTLLEQQQRIEQAMGRVGQAVTAGFQTVSRDLAATGQRLEAAIAQHNQRIEQAMNAQGETLRRYVDGQVAAATADFNNQLGSVASALDYQRDAMAEAAQRAQWQQERLFRQAQEQQRQIAYDSRRCAEILARRGKYGWLDGC